jgi:hypothetical protein
MTGSAASLAASLVAQTRDVKALHHHLTSGADGTRTRDLRSDSPAL